MKLHVDLALKVGKFELEFKTFELKMKLARDLAVLNVKPKKLGLVIGNFEHVFHVEVAFLLAHIGFFYFKDVADVIVPEVVKVADEVVAEVEKVADVVEADVVKVVDDVKASV